MLKFPKRVRGKKVRGKRVRGKRVRDKKVRGRGNPPRPSRFKRPLRKLTKSQRL